MESSTNPQVFLSPPISYVKLGFFRTLRIISKPTAKLTEIRWFKIDKEGSVFELESHNKDSLWLGPMSQANYGKYYCEVKIEGSDDVIKTEPVRVMHPESKLPPKPAPKPEMRKKSNSCSHIETIGSSHSSTGTSPNISPAHPYYRGFMSRNASVSSPPPSTSEVFRSPSGSQPEKKIPQPTNSTPVSPEKIPELRNSTPVSPELVETGNSSSSSYVTHEDSFPDLPKIRPLRIFRRDSTFSSESDIFFRNLTFDVPHLTSTPTAHSGTPDWSLASTGYPMASPSLNYSISSSLPASPASQLRNTFFEMATLPRRSSLSPLSSRSDTTSRPYFKNEQDLRLVGYQQVSSPLPSAKSRPASVTSHFRFSLASTSKFRENN